MKKKDPNLQKILEDSIKANKPLDLEHLTFNMGYSFIPRAFYIQLDKLMQLLHKYVVKQNQKIKINNIPQLEQDEKVQYHYPNFEKYLENLQNGQFFTGSNIYDMVINTFKKEFIFSHIYVALSMGIKSLNSIPIQQIIYNFQIGERDKAVGWAFLLFVILLISVFLQNISFYVVQNLSANIRLSLVTLLYRKCINLANCQIQQANVGKLFNMVSYDLGAIEMMMYFPFMVIYIPLLLLIAAIVLYGRLGGYGIIGIGIIVLSVPVQLINGVIQMKSFVTKNKMSDNRVKLIGESIDGIRLVKMYGWEEAFADYISTFRVKELQSLFKITFIRTLDRANSMGFVLVAAFIPILIIHYNGEVEMSSSKIFATLEQLYNLKNVLFLTGIGVGFLFQLKVILSRFAEFMTVKKHVFSQLLQNEKFDPQLFEKQRELYKKQEKLKEEFEKYVKTQEKNQQQIDQLILQRYELTKEEKSTLEIKNERHIEQQHNILPPEDPSNACELFNFSGFWDKNKPPCLKNMTLDIKKNHFYAVVGKVGSGKTSFLQLFLDEIPYFQGTIRKKGTVSFVEQEPYIFSGKVRDNILFGKKYDHDLYTKVIKACCLKADFKQFADGDQTEIGEKGVTLSGGQKARLSLARSVYSESDIYLLDDPLSAVDAKVAKKLHDRCLNGFLAGKTVILSTHQIHFTRKCSQIIVLQDGKISQLGKFSQLEDTLLQMANAQTFGGSQIFSQYEESNTNLESLAILTPEQLMVDIAQNKKKGKLFTEEMDEKIVISSQTYTSYMKLVKNNPILIFTLILFLASEGLYSAFYYYFGYYDYEQNKDTLFAVSGVLLLLYIIMCIVKYTLIAYAVNTANKHMHQAMVDCLVRTNIQYFDQTQSGRIINKFSNDIGNLDLQFTFMLVDSIEAPLQFINIVVTVAIFNPYLLILIFFFCIVLYLYFQYCKPLIILSKQTDLIYKSPVFSFFSRTIQGIIHVRIYNQISRFLEQMYVLANDSIRTNYLFWRINRTFQFNLQVASSLFTFVGYVMNIYLVLRKQDFGQTIVYLTMIIELVVILTRQLINLDSNMTSVERTLQISRLPFEGELVTKHDEEMFKKLNIQNQKVKQWVQRGELRFDNVKMRYRPDLDLVLRGTTFTIQGGETVGCVGRTGAGKSSILQTLFRMCYMEPESKIYLDGVDISLLGLHTLRNNISIIPQIPFVFSGSIRRNLDPLEQYTDEQLWKVLDQTNLSDSIRKLEDGLLTDMSNVQSVFSTGQKQLICLARAILKNSKILVLDEATANVDMQTDEFIQNAIKKAFKKSTIFTIAHRLNTIADYDKVLVLDKGVVAEYDAPFRLLVKDFRDNDITSDSIFADMVKNTGKENSKTIFRIAKGRYQELHQMDE